MFEIRKATKKQSKLRVLLEGASGSGKTKSGLILIESIAKKYAVIDTERGSSELYSDAHDFDVLRLESPYTPERYIEAIIAVQAAGYDGVLIDSITHEWNGPGGCLEIQDKLGGRFQDWAKVTPRHQKFIDTILGCNMHVVATVRSKVDYSFDPTTKKVTKQGMAPQQRDGMDFEMTLVFALNQAHMATATKDRTNIFDGNQEHVIVPDTGKKILDWLNSGEKVPGEKELAEKMRAAKAEKHLINVWTKYQSEIKKYPGLIKVKDEVKQSFKNNKPKPEEVNSHA